MRTPLSDGAFATRMLAVADALLREFSDLPLVEVVTAINAARRRLTVASDEIPDPERIASAARERLGARAPAASADQRRYRGSLPSPAP